MKEDILQKKKRNIHKIAGPAGHLEMKERHEENAQK